MHAIVLACKRVRKEMLVSPATQNPSSTRGITESAFQQEKTTAVTTHMSLSKMKFSTLDLGRFKRPDEESVEIAARLYECPSEYDYWLAIFDIVHKSRKTMHMTSFVPKAVASTIDAAKILLKGDGLAQVKSKFLEAGPAILTIDITKTLDSAG